MLPTLGAGGFFLTLFLRRDLCIGASVEKCGQIAYKKVTVCMVY